MENTQKIETHNHCEMKLGNCETSYARSAILIENKKRIRLAHESLDEKVNQLILGAL